MWWDQAGLDQAGAAEGRLCTKTFPAHQGVMGRMFVSHQNSYVEALSPKVCLEVAGWDLHDGIGVCYGLNVGVPLKFIC